MVSLKQRIFAAFLISSVVLLAMMFAVTQGIIQREFTKYIEETHRRQDQDILQYIAEAVAQEGRLDAASLIYLAHQSMMEGFLITIYDPADNILWRNDEAAMDLHRNNRFHAPQVPYHELIHPIELEGTLLYQVGIARSHDYFFSPEDLRFQRSLYIALLLTVIAAILVAAFYSFLLSGQLSAPIVEIKDAAYKLKEGRLNTRVRTISGTQELQALAESINHLGESLERQEALRRRLTSDVSHELRTPLNALQSYLEALMDGIWEPTEAHLKSCHGEVLRLTAIVNELEKLTQLDNKALELKRTEISLNALLRQVVQQFLPKYKEKNLVLDLIEEQAVTVYADDHKLKQVMINLLSNAFKYTPADGKAEVILKREGNRAVIIVRDTGIGIPKADLANVFERFYRSEPSRSRETGGAGLGLSIAASIIEAHGGTITVESIENVGTEFVITLCGIRGHVNDRLS